MEIKLIENFCSNAPAKFTQESDSCVKQALLTQLFQIVEKELG